MSSAACPALQYFSKLSRKRHEFRENVTEHKCGLTFCTAFVWSVSHSKKNWARCDTKCTSVCMWSARHSCSSSMKLEFSCQIFEKYSNITFNENLFIGNRVVPCGRQDRRTDMTKLIVSCRKFVNASKNSTFRPQPTVYLCVLCGSENKQRLFPYTALTDRFL
jgi:hypothetical protein